VNDALAQSHTRCSTAAEKKMYCTQPVLSFMHTCCKVCSKLGVITIVCYMVLPQNSTQTDQMMQQQTCVLLHESHNRHQQAAAAQEPMWPSHRADLSRTSSSPCHAPQAFCFLAPPPAAAAAAAAGVPACPCSCCCCFLLLMQQSAPQRQLPSRLSSTYTAP